MLRISKILNIFFAVFDVILFALFFGLGLGIAMNATSIASGINHPHADSTVIQAIGRTYFGISFIFLVILGFSIIYNQKIKCATSKDQFMPWAILMVIFGYLIVGLLALLANENEYANNAIKIKSTSIPNDNNDITMQLQKLKSLYDQGLISEEDYNNKKKEILDKM